jgi:catechol 2,3-dioxygenase-like lactoylglutathione lyase family enzyme
MNLGTFSISLAVKDIKASRAFYERLGFAAFDGDEAQNWLMLRNGDTKIGLFQGMFEANTLTFNPPDVRGIQKALKAGGATLVLEADESTTGPAHAMLLDPDGNPILLDQHA